MDENWDSFPSNLCEMLSKIPRKSFTFNYKRFEVWQNGQCIHSGNSYGQIVASVINNDLHVTIDDAKINSYIKKNFSFGEISTNLNRVMWSKDLFNRTGRTEKFNPDISSLFYKNGILSKVTFTIHDPNILVEFYG